MSDQFPPIEGNPVENGITVVFGLVVIACMIGMCVGIFL